jgi:glycosyltransferase involved in cell wall biosynthesis
MIYIDASRYGNTDKKTGVENYSYFLINELVKLMPDGITLIAPKKNPLNVRQIIIPFPRLWTQIRLSFEIIINKKIDNLFVPSHVLPLICPKKSAITIHDVAWRRLPESYGLFSKWYLEWTTEFAVRHAEKIIVPSETTKNDLIDFYKAEHQKIHVIPLGFQPPRHSADENGTEEVIGKWKSDCTAGGLKIKNYFLYVGRIEHKKNTDTLIKAFSLFAENNADIKLALAGFPGKGGAEIINSIPDSVKNRIIITGYVSEKEKDALMKNALCFVFPSRYEGFGLPLLEAMSAGLPIIASKIPAFYEIAKENALFFNPSDAKELAGLMNKIATDKNIARLITARHTDTLKKYSWEKCARKTLDILRDKF